ncbi:hypothetical protein [Turicimonas muris]|uniref:hypothetical protein n=1 Tax=Turicimonas muris TaxID=1796652 RepID=UPI0012ED2404|nr:hypothetical protein [Turicimonas muris]
MKKVGEKVSTNPMVTVGLFSDGKPWLEKTKSNARRANLIWDCFTPILVLFFLW